MNNLSFIVVVTFGYGIGTKKVDAGLIRELKKNKCLIDGTSRKSVVKMINSDIGCTEHKYTMRINLKGLKILLQGYICPDEVVHTMGSLTLEYGLCDAIAFNSSFRQTYKDTDNYLILCKMLKALGKDPSSIWSHDCPHVVMLANYMTECCDFSACVTPVLETEDGFTIYEEIWNFFESLISCEDLEDKLNEFFEDERFNMY